MIYIKRKKKEKTKEETCKILRENRRSEVRKKKRKEGKIREKGKDLEEISKKG